MGLIRGVMLTCAEGIIPRIYRRIKDLARICGWHASWEVCIGNYLIIQHLGGNHVAAGDTYG